MNALLLTLALAGHPAQVQPVARVHIILVGDELTSKQRHWIRDRENKARRDARKATKARGISTVRTVQVKSKPTKRTARRSKKRCRGLGR